MKIHAALLLALIAVALADNTCSSGSNCKGCQNDCPQRSCSKCLLPARPAACLPAGYTDILGVGSYKVYQRAVGWGEARYACNSDGGYLVIVNSNPEAEAIATLWDESGLPDGVSDYVWSGFHDQITLGSYETILDQPIAQAGYDWWLAGTNLSDPARRCGVLTRRRNSVFLTNDNCTDPHPFICERPLCC